MTSTRRPAARRRCLGLGYPAPLEASWRAFASGWAVSGAMLLLLIAAA